MLVVHPVGLGQASYYLDGRSPGIWTGAGSATLGLAGAVDPPPFIAALSGCDSLGKVMLQRRSPRRRAGFDLVFAAPKSLSLLVALTEGGGPVEPAPGPSPLIVAAHDAAVADTLGYLERWATWTRRGAEHRRIPVSGLVAARFRHRTNWTDEPHIHTHVIVANLVYGEDGRWSCLDSRTLYHHTQAATAVYHASLRYQLACAGFSLDWTIKPNGLGDITGVPRAAIDACSSRRQAILLAEAGQAPASPAARAAARGRTRRNHDPLVGLTGSWETRAAVTGLDRSVAAALVAPQPVRPVVSDHVPDSLGPIVDGSLSTTLSSFGHSDCVRLAAANLPAGAPSAAIEAWAARFMDAAIPVGGQRWVTATLRRSQQRITSLVEQRSARVGLARPETIARALADRPGLDATAREAVAQLTTSGVCVQRLGYGPFLAQAAVLEAAQHAWEASGHRVAVIAPNLRAAARWRALCGLDAPPPRPHHASIVIVDGAERVCTAELHRIIADGTSRQAKVILVEGGTGPAPSRSVGPAFGELQAVLPALQPGTAVVPERAAEPVRGGLDNSVAVVASSQEALNALVADWADARVGDQPVVMVALGAEEAGALNSLARRRLDVDGALSGPAVTFAGQEWRAGDELRVLRRHRLLGPAPAGTLGAVTAVDPTAGTVTIRWPAGSKTVMASDLGRSPATYAYATTPAYLRYWDEGPVLSLGDPGRPSLHLDPAPTLYLVAHPPPTRDAPDGPVGRLVSQLQLASSPTADRAAATIPGADRQSGGPPASLAEPAAVAPTIGPGPGDDRPAHWSLGALAESRRVLGDRLAASAPPDTDPERRRLEEQRTWQRATGDRPDELDQRIQALAAADGVRRQWIEAHAGELRQWVGLGEAMTRRADALAVAAEARPSRTVRAEIGPPPDDRDGGQWRRAAQALESFRDRWSLADDPAGLELVAPSDGIDPARRHDQALVVAAVRTLARGRALSRGPPQCSARPVCFRACGRPAAPVLSDPAGLSELFHGVWRTTMTPSHPPPDPSDSRAISPLVECCAGS